jgi:hypothetical protein
MSTLVIGHKGNMGRRYTTILDHLGEHWIGADFGDAFPDSETFQRVIVATPTDSHVRIIRSLFAYRVPILCEKPVCKDLDALRGLIDDCRKLGVKLTMINQYAYLHGPKFDPSERSYYNYFKSGGDGLAWDCINILGLAAERATLSNDSPRWLCQINGRSLSIGSMDQGYIDMLNDWLSNPKENLDYILKAHKRAYDYERSLHQDSDRHPSEIDERKTA